MLESKVCKYCGCVFYKRYFPKVFNRMITCGKKKCRDKHKQEWTYSAVCIDCGKPIVYFATRCKICSSLGENNPFYGKTHKPESLININLFKVGSIPFMKGKHHKSESNFKNSLAHQGENSSNWQGGKSFEPYTTEWNKQLKTLIRDRDNHTCQICEEKEKNKAFSVHHIDYDKKNCFENNLITLCKRCHTKTNYNRSFWIQYFNHEKNIFFSNNRTVA